MKRQSTLSFIMLFLLCTTSLYSVEKTETISLKSAVVFNTLCAKCHEGQCSGRLSFDTGSEAATNQIKRYATDIKWNINNLSDFAIASHTNKRRHTFYFGSDFKSV